MISQGMIFMMKSSMIVSTAKYGSVLFLLLLFGSQCRTMQTKKSVAKEYKLLYIDQFKLTYLRKVLRAGFNQSEAINNLVEFDRSGFTEPLLSEEDYRLIDSLVYIDNLQMMADSTNSIGRVAEGAEGKHVFGFILNKLESKWIDSLAKRRYKSSGVQNLYKE